MGAERHSSEATVSMTMTSGAPEPPTRDEDTMDTSIRLHHVFDEGKPDPYSGNLDDDGDNERSLSAPRRSRMDPSRSGRARLSSRRLHTSLTMERAEPESGMEEDASIQSSASTSRTVSRGGRHRLTSATVRRTSVTQDSVLGLSSTLLKAIKGDFESDDEEENLIEDQPPEPRRTRSRLDERVRSRRSIRSTDTVVTSESLQTSNTQQSRHSKPPSTRRHPAGRADRGESLQKSHSTRKIKSDRTKPRPRRSKSDQVESAQMSKSDTTHGSSILPTESAQSTSRRSRIGNDSVPALPNTGVSRRRPSGRSASRARRSESFVQQHKEAAMEAAQAAQLKTKKISLCKATAAAAAQAAQVKKIAQSAKSKSADSAMDGSNNGRTVRQKGGSKKIAPPSRDTLVRAKSTRQCHPSRDKHPDPRGAGDGQKANVSPTGDRRQRQVGKQRVNGPTKNDASTLPPDSASPRAQKRGSKGSCSRGSWNESFLVGAVEGSGHTGDSKRGPSTVASGASKNENASPRLPDLASPRAKKRGSRGSCSRGSWNESYVVAAATDGSARTRESRRGFSTSETEDDPVNQAFVGAGGDFIAVFHDSDLSESEDEDYRMSMSRSRESSANGSSRRRDSGSRRRSPNGIRNSSRRRHGAGKVRARDKRGSNDTGESSVLMEEDIGEFANFSNCHAPLTNDGENDAEEPFDDDDECFFNDAGLGDVLQFDPTQVGMVQRVKQITSDKKGYEINGLVGQIGEILDPVTSLQDFSQAKGPLFNLFDDAPGLAEEEFRPNSPSKAKDKQACRDGDETSDSPVSQRRKSALRRGGKNECDNEEDDDDDGSFRRDFISPATLGYEDPAGLKSPTKEKKSIAKMASGYFRNILNASQSDILDDDKSQISNRSSRSGKPGKSARNSFAKLFTGSIKKKDRGTLLPDDEDLSMSETDHDGGDLFR